MEAQLPKSEKAKEKGKNLSGGASGSGGPGSGSVGKQALNFLDKFNKPAIQESAKQPKRQETTVKEKAQKKQEAQRGQRKQQESDRLKVNKGQEKQQKKQMDGPAAATPKAEAPTPEKKDQTISSGQEMSSI